MTRAQLRYVTIDTLDPEPLLPFWTELLDAEVGYRSSDGVYVELDLKDAPELHVLFQRVPEAKSGKNRVHLDLQVEDLEEAVAWVVDHGGHELSGEQEVDGFRWHVVADPEGNEFCVVLS